MIERVKFRDAADAIDTGWYYSWHWEKNHGDYLTPKAVKQAITDGERRLRHLRERVSKLERVLVRLRAEHGDNQPDE